MTLAELKANGWVVVRRFHQEEAYYYYTATKGRNILTSDNGSIFRGQLNGQWI